MSSLGLGGGRHERCADTALAPCHSCLRRGGRGQQGDAKLTYSAPGPSAPHPLEPLPTEPVLITGTCREQIAVLPWVLVLSCGLSFCHTIQLNSVQLYGDLDAFFYCVKERTYIQDKEPCNYQPTTDHAHTQHKKNSFWTPPEDCSPTLDIYIHYFCLCPHSVITQENQQGLHHNLSPEKWRISLSLNNNSDIIIQQRHCSHAQNNGLTGRQETTFQTGVLQTPDRIPWHNTRRN